jgi:excisionase family DNA binding protein
MNHTVYPLLNRAQAAAYLGVALRTIDELISKGSLACVRIGRSVRFRESALADFVEANETRVTPKRRRVARGKTSTGATA